MILFSWFSCIKCKNIPYKVDSDGLFAPPNLIKDMDTPAWWGLIEVLTIFSIPHNFKFCTCWKLNILMDVHPPLKNILKGIFTPIKAKMKVDPIWIKNQGIFHISPPPEFGTLSKIFQFLQWRSPESLYLSHECNVFDGCYFVSQIFPKTGAENKVTILINLKISIPKTI